MKRSIALNKQFFNYNLFSLLGLNDSRILTFIGGGGKTSLMNTLGKEFANQGIPTLLTTTTHIMKPDFLPEKSCIEEEKFEQLVEIFSNFQEQPGEAPLAALGIPEKLINGNVKWKSPSMDFCERTAEFSTKCSIKTAHESLKILCEGDGSKRLPIKLPKEGEPVFFPKTDTVIGVVGLSCLKKPIKETLFRYELLQECIFVKSNIETASIPHTHYESHRINKTPEIFFSQNPFIASLQPTDPVTIDFLYWLCLSPKGLRKNISSQKFCIVFNQADIIDEKTLARVVDLRNKLEAKGICSYIVSLKNKYIVDK